jgi:hypothetical protein
MRADITQRIDLVTDLREHDSDSMELDDHRLTGRHLIERRRAD